MFILNDPYRGAIHQPDVSIVMPIFHEGRRIAWTGSCAHELDTGGMTFGSWAFAATEVQQEAMLLPGVKLIENGVLREDIWQMIMGMTRLPHVVGPRLQGDDRGQQRRRSPLSPVDGPLWRRDGAIRSCAPRSTPRKRGCASASNSSPTAFTARAIFSTMMATPTGFIRSKSRSSNAAMH